MKTFVLRRKDLEWSAEEYVVNAKEKSDLVEILSKGNESALTKVDKNATIEELEELFTIEESKEGSGVVYTYIW